jgi:Flp pilus assembly protein TadD
MQLGDQMRAEGSINRALALEPSSSQAYLLLGYLRVRQNNFPAALDAFKQASTFDPTDTTSLCMAGYALNKMSRPREAAAYYQQALKVDPNDQMAHQFLAGTGGD